MYYKNYANAIQIFMKDKNEVLKLVDDFKKQKIYIRGPFGPPIENCARITIAPIEHMRIFIRAFENWLSENKR